MGRRTRIVVVVAAGLVLISPTQVSAAPQPFPATAYWADSNSLKFDGGYPKVNDLEVTKLDQWTWVFDDIVAITPGTDCFRPTADPTVVHCVQTYQDQGAIVSLGIDLSNLDDTLDYRAATKSYTTIRGGPDDDTIRLWPEIIDHNVVYGDGGNDTIQATGTHFVKIIGGPGNDAMCGGSATWIDYTSHPAAVTASIGGGVGDDGTPGVEQDTICGSVRGVIGTQYDDIIRSWDRGGKVLSGELGDDTLAGSIGGDTLWGGPGSDHLDGGGGVDWLHGDDGYDHCIARPNDTLYMCESATIGP